MLPALLAPLLCGCAGSSVLREGIAPKVVNLSALDTCTRILAPVALPNVTATTDARVAFARDDAALIIARGEIAHGRDCIADVKNRYATGK